MNFNVNKNRRPQNNDRHSIFKYNNTTSPKKVIDIPFQFNESLFPSLSQINNPSSITNDNITFTQNDYLNELKKTTPKIQGIKRHKKVSSIDVVVDTTDKYDFTPVIKMWQKRKEEYIDLYGIDIYEKMFIFPDKMNIYNVYVMDMIDLEDKTNKEEYENYDEIYDVYY
jgi:hypothetical protein